MAGTGFGVVSGTGAGVVFGIGAGVFGTGFGLVLGALAFAFGRPFLPRSRFMFCTCRPTEALPALRATPLAIAYICRVSAALSARLKSAVKISDKP